MGAARIEPTDTIIGDQAKIANVAAITSDLAGGLKLPLDKGVVISHRIWENEFDGSANAVGSQTRIDNANFKIEAIALDRLDGFYSDRPVELWIPFEKQDLQSDGRDTRDLWVLAVFAMAFQRVRRRPSFVQVLPAFLK